MILHYLKNLLFTNQFKKAIDWYNKQYHLFKIKELIYFKERLTERTCYDCKHICYKNKLICKHDNKEIHDFKKGCNNYDPDNKIIKRNFLVK